MGFMDNLENVFVFIGGLGLFLYGMHVMAEGLQKSAGGKLKNLMAFLTKNRFIAVVVGALITAIIQSSSATTVMVVGFVNAGMLSLTQAVGVIMGANIGTTITAWIVSANEWMGVLKPEFFAPVLVGIGAFVLLFSRSDNKKKIGEIFVGFGVLFIGLTFMSNGIKPYRESEIFVQAFAVLGKNPLLGILAGAVVTAVIQSSSASVGILQTLAANGVVNWGSAIFITLGQNIGTCVTALISSAGAGKNAKRASVIHLLFNIIGTAIVGVVMYVVFLVNRSWAGEEINSVQISIFHTTFNVVVTLAMFPFANGLVKLSQMIVRDNEVEAGEEKSAVAELVQRLDRRILANPAFAIETANREIKNMAVLAYENIKSAVLCLKDNTTDNTKEIFEKEIIINEYEKLITPFLVEIDNTSLSEVQHEQIKNMFYIISDIERIADYAENIAKLSLSKKKDNVEFSSKGVKDLELIESKTLELLEIMVENYDMATFEIIKMADFIENEIDDLEEEIREKHINRLSKGKCSIESGVIFLDTISYLERVSDHASGVIGYNSTYSN